MAGMAMAGRYAIPGLLGASLGAGGTLLGNLTDKEKGEGKARLLTESAMAGSALASAPASTFLAQGLGIIPNTINTPFPRFDRNFPGGASQYLPKSRAGKLAVAATLPLAAGLQGLIGGGVSNVADAIGLPGFNKGIDPEAYGSSNLQQTRPNVLYQMRTDLNR